jgi:hypothetical protein
MVIIRFPDEATEDRALGELLGRFPGKTFAGGETSVPEPAAAQLASIGISFTVVGRANHEQLAPLRVPAAAAA